MHYFIERTFIFTFYPEANVKSFVIENERVWYTPPKKVSRQADFLIRVLVCAAQTT